MGPPDPILGLTDSFNKDTDPKKIGLTVGAYRCDDGKPYVLPSVRKAEEKIMSQGLNKEYAGITGVPSFVKASLGFAYGADSEVLSSNRVAGTQTLSGTGACRLAVEYLSRFVGKGAAIHVPDPTWANHIPIIEDGGCVVKKYKYYDPKTIGLNFSGMLDDVNAAQDGSIFMLHACAHNPTGVDPTVEQWKEISALFKKKNHLAFFDCAYQGFASGNPETDAASLRSFVADGHKIVLAQSFAKNFGLYGERVGCFSVVTADAEETKRVDSQLKILIRPMYSNPPISGARIVSEILNDDALHKQWAGECKGMADRIIRMRSLLVQKLASAGSTKSWEHVTSQIGMFCYSGLTGEQCDQLRTDFHIYLTRNGRISMAGITEKNVDHLAASIHAVTK
jgi:aspartate aminotransferase